MRMRVRSAGSSGLTLSKIGINGSLTLGAFARIFFQVGGSVNQYVMLRPLSFSGDGCLIYSDFWTDWYEVAPEGTFLPNMENQIGELIVSGSTGRADIKFTIYNEFNKPICVMERALVFIGGALLGGFTLKAIMKKEGIIKGPDPLHFKIPIQNQRIK